MCYPKLATAFLISDTEVYIYIYIYKVTGDLKISYLTVRSLYLTLFYVKNCSNSSENNLIDVKNLRQGKKVSEIWPITVLWHWRWQPAPLELTELTVIWGETKFEPGTLH
jgi:hypothetical protein